MSKQWEKAQVFEKEWWGDCLNTFGEEEKQLTYFQKMGFKLVHNGKSPYNVDLDNKTVLDIGGGACSFLLKCLNRPIGCYVIDPIFKSTPQWVIQRYVEGGIIPIGVKAEEIGDQPGKVFDEVWIYNCLQHVEDPEKIIQVAKEKAKIIRIFEWIGIADEHGHPHSLDVQSLNKWLGGEGKVEVLNQNTLRGKCYYGIFKGDKYDRD